MATIEPVKLEYPQPYKQLIAALIAWGIPAENVGIGGGFARDHYFNRPYKDMDVVVVGGWPWHIQEATFEMMLPPGWEIEAVHENDPAYADLGADFDDRLDKVLTFVYTGDEVQLSADILVASEGFKTVEEHIRMNDFNINHFHISALGLLQGWPPAYISLDPYGTLRQARFTTVSNERKQRFIEYAHSINWAVDV